MLPIKKLPFDRFKALIDKSNKNFTDEELKKLREYLYLILRIDLDLFYTKRMKLSQSGSDGADDYNELNQAS